MKKFGKKFAAENFKKKIAEFLRENLENKNFKIKKNCQKLAKKFCGKKF